jgi:hypothetical protein
VEHSLQGNIKEKRFLGKTKCCAVFVGEQLWYLSLSIFIQQIHNAIIPITLCPSTPLHQHIFLPHPLTNPPIPQLVPWSEYMYPPPNGPWQSRVAAAAAAVQHTPTPTSFSGSDGGGGGGGGACTGGFRKAIGCLAFGPRDLSGDNVASCDALIDPGWAGYCECGGGGGGDHGSEAGSGDGDRGEGGGERGRGRGGIDIGSSIGSSSGAGSSALSGAVGAVAAVECFMDGESLALRRQLTCTSLCNQHATWAKVPLGDSNQPSTNGSCVAWRGAQGAHPAGPPRPSSSGSSSSGDPSTSSSAPPSGCGRVVPAGEAGFCECEGGAVAGVSTKVHPPLTCAAACLALAQQQQRLRRRSWRGRGLPPLHLGS